MEEILTAEVKTQLKPYYMTRTNLVTNTMIHLGNAYANEQNTVFRIDALTYEAGITGPHQPPKLVKFIRIRDNKSFVRPGADVRDQIESGKLSLIAEECIIPTATTRQKENGLVTIQIVHPTT